MNTSPSTGAGAFIHSLLVVPPEQQRADITFSNTLFHANAAAASTGGVYVTMDPTSWRVSFTGCRFTANIAPRDAGAATVVGTLLLTGEVPSAGVVVKDTHCSGNMAEVSGAGCFSFTDVALAVITNSSIEDNTGSTGGGLYVQGSILHASKVVLARNTVSGRGGGLFVHAAAPIGVWESHSMLAVQVVHLSDMHITDNRVQYHDSPLYGAGVAVMANVTWAAISVDRVLFEGNTFGNSFATAYGGGLFVSAYAGSGNSSTFDAAAGSVSFSGCTFRNNQATSGAALQVHGFSTRIANTGIEGNFGNVGLSVRRPGAIVRIAPYNSGPARVLHELPRAATITNDAAIVAGVPFIDFSNVTVANNLGGHGLM